MWGRWLSPLGCMGLCLGIPELATKQPPFLGPPSCHCSVKMFGFVGGFMGADFTKAGLLPKHAGMEGV